MVRNKNKKIEIKGWLDEGEEYKSIVPKECPKCSGRVGHTNALQTCGLFFIYCVNSKCRWCKLYKENKNGELIEDEN